MGILFASALAEGVRETVSIGNKFKAIWRGMMNWRFVIGTALLATWTIGNTQEWGCYDPQPGHPTISERKAFVDDVSRYALNAERKYGVPAPAIVAMAIHESGYGYTRIGLNANNLFGFKWTSATSAGRRGAWELTCQPNWDKNRFYIQFKDRADAIDFVAGRLAHSRYYQTDTEAFKAAMVRGDDRPRAIAAWVDGISDPYNYDPPSYTRTIKRLLNNALAPSDTLSSTGNLYRLVLTETSNPAVSNLPTINADKTAIQTKVLDLFKRGIDSGGRYMERNCKDIPESDPLFSGVLAPYRGLSAKGISILDCRYPFAGKTARILMANVDATQLARWTVSACKANSIDDLDRCLEVTSHSIWCGSNAQFAISGVVREPADICGGPAGKEGLITFRDGVTVETENVPYCATKPLSEQEEQASVIGKVARTKRIGRIAMVNREMYQKAGGKVDVSAMKPNALGKIAWLDVVRDGYLEAIGQDTYPLLGAWVKFSKAQFGRYRNLSLDDFNCKAYFDTK
jgi:hypothetical protein